MQVPRTRTDWGPYLPRLVAGWLGDTPDVRHRQVAGTLVFADISGFTRLTERLARRGRVGAEAMSDALDRTFGALLGVAADDGADLVKWGGDAVLLLFDGPDHAARACRAAHAMRTEIRAVGRLDTVAGRATLRMSIGVHSGSFDFFLVGDAAHHRELLLTGADVNTLIELEAAARAGDIVVGPATVRLLEEAGGGGSMGRSGRLLVRPPAAPVFSRPPVRQRPTTLLHRALPVPIRAHLQLGAGEPEHRAVAVAFVQFGGTDHLLASRPGHVAEALEQMVSHVSRVANDYDVTFLESDIAVDGGKILLVAGAPTSSGHDADRLLRACRSLVDGAGELPLRIGAAFGHVFAGDFGPTFRRTYSVKGDVVNLAARLCAKAEPGQVLATRALTEHAGTAFTTVELPPLTVKGRSGPVRAVDLGPVSGARVPTPATGGLLVGRRHEMGVLDDGLEQARHRRGRLVHVVGEPGIGKSRLLAELVEIAADLQVLSVRCDEYESSTPYHPFRLLLRDLLGVTATTGPAAAVGRLHARCDVNAPDLLPWLPLLGTVLDLPIAETPETRGLEEEFRKRRLELVVSDLLHNLLATPALIVLDDAQHMDGASLDLLTRLARQAPQEPWLIVVSGREQPDGWQPPPDGEPVHLRPAPLSDEESIHLLQAATESRPLPRPTIAALAARAEGNPLFLESLLFATDGSGQVDDLPETVEELVTAQFDRLTPPDRTVLRYASVLGMSFDARDLAGLVDGHTPQPGPSTYTRLAEFIVAGAGTSRRFRHALMRDVAYEGLPYRSRRALHDQVALALERAELSDPPTPERLSFHFFHAGRFDKAWEYSVRSGHLARAKFANPEAVDFFTRAVECERRGRTGMVSAAELGDVLELIGDTWFTIGLTDNAMAAYRRARRELRADRVRTAEVVAREARVDQRLRKFPQSLRKVTRALHDLEGVTGRRACGARSVLAMRYAISRFGQGHVDAALRWGELAAKQAEEAIDTAALARAYGTLHGIYVATGRAANLPYGELALQAYVELDDLPGQADCINNIAAEAFGDHQWVEAAESFGRAAQTYRRIGDTAGEGNALFNQADVLVRQGHLAQARDLLAEALTIARAVSDEELVALVLREMGRAACRSGDSAGVAHLEEAHRIFARIGAPDELPATEVALAEAHLLRRAPRECLRLTADLLQTTVDIDSALRPAVRWIRGFALLESGRADEAAMEFEAGVAAGRQHDDRYAHALNSIGLARTGTDRSNGHRQVAMEALRALGVVGLPLPERNPVPV